MRKFLPAFILTSLLVGNSFTWMPAQAATEPRPFVIIVEDKEISFDPSPILIQDTAFVPLRSLANALGAQVHYDSKTDTATITKGDLVVTINLASGAVEKNHVVMVVEPAPRVMQDRTMVPIRFLTEVFGNEVRYEGATQTIQVLPTQQTLEQRDRIQNIVKHSREVLNAQKSYSMRALVNYSVVDQDNKNLSLEGSLDSCYTSDPFLIHEKVSTTFYDDEGRGSVYDIHQYLTKDAMYFSNLGGAHYFYGHLFGRSKWDQFARREDDSFLDLSNRVSLLTAKGQPDAWMAPILPYATVSEDDTTYHVHYRFDVNGVKKFLAVQSDDLLESILHPAVSIDLLVDIEKATYRPSGYSMQAHGGDQSTVQLAVTWKDFDAVPPIVIPDEVHLEANDQSKR